MAGDECAAFMARIDASGKCWLWKGGYRFSKALKYGRVYVQNRAVPAHRRAYELFVGPIPEGATIDHLCRETMCVRPEHLEAVRLRDNILRGNGMTARGARKTHCPRGHPYDLFNTEFYRTKAGHIYRWCRICRDARRVARNLVRRIPRPVLAHHRPALTAEERPG